MYMLTPYFPLAYPLPSHSNRVYICISSDYKLLNHVPTPSNNPSYQPLTSDGADIILPVVSAYRT